MSTFKVECKPISKVWNHPNADRLDLAQIEGLDFQFVVGREQYKVGDMVVYFPLDSMLPKKLVTFLGLDGRLHGKEQNVIRTAKLRGEISQGIVLSKKQIHQYIEDNNIDLVYFDGRFDGPFYEIDYTETLNIIKYESPDIPCQNGTLKPLPEGVGVYDIEGIERHQRIVDMLMDVPCLITEKIEGMNWSLTIDKDDKIFVNQRNYTIEESTESEHMFWKVAREQGLIELAKITKKRNCAKQVTLRGEFIGPGVQGNYYELMHHKVLLFDIKVDNKYINDGEFDSFTDDKMVPVLAYKETLRQWLSGRTITEASTGISMLINKLREGIVIKPMIEMYDEKFGRIIIKKRSPEYLAKTRN